MENRKQPQEPESITIRKDIFKEIADTMYKGGYDEGLKNATAKPAQAATLKLFKVTIAGTTDHPGATIDAVFHEPTQKWWAIDPQNKMSELMVSPWEKIEPA